MTRLKTLPRLLLFLLCCTAAQTTLSAAEPVAWSSLLDKDSVKLWKPATGFEFKKSGKVQVADKLISLPQGDPATGIRWSGKFPQSDYDLQLQARRTAGSDFFCGLTFPVGKSEVTLILGGWGGGVCGLSRIDGFYAVENETAKGYEFKQSKWYQVLVEVREKKLRINLDGELFIELDTIDRKLEASEEMKPCSPLGIATWRTSGEVRQIQYRLHKK